MLIRTLFLLCIYHIFEEVTACHPDAKKKQDADAVIVWDYYIKMFKPYGFYGEGGKPMRNRTHFEITNELAAKYGKWLIDYVYNKTKHQKNIPKPHPMAHHLWELYGGDPIDGDDPPVWAYIEGTGRPLFCYEHAAYGDCDQQWYRWGFNTFKQECEIFIWSGCGGTFNNFVRKRNCDLHCKNPPQSSCVTIPEYGEAEYEYNVRYDDVTPRVPFSTG